MAKVVYLRPNDMLLSIKSHYAEANVHLEECRRLNKEVDLLSEELSRLHDEEHAVVMQGVIAYLDSDAEQVFAQRRQEVFERKAQLIEESQQALDKGSAKLKWIKETFG